ncbi:MAG: hypothetical protein BWY74_02544 [Firmicutes bacterium ADurb.Bin419]|nr:MAG: hypothetical protein BWY74_02544 [Firmicutes bacterium ADurb.Bin419]
MITNDNYYAIIKGPVPSATQDITELRDEFKFAKEYINPNPDLKSIVSVKSVDIDAFSKSDIEALEFIWDKFGKLNNQQLIKLTHAFHEWKIHEDELKDAKRSNMEIEDFFSNAGSKEYIAFGKRKLKSKKDAYLACVQG